MVDTSIPIQTLKYRSAGKSIVGDPGKNGQTLCEVGMSYNPMYGVKRVKERDTEENKKRITRMEETRQPEIPKNR